MHEVGSGAMSELTSDARDAFLAGCLAGFLTGLEDKLEDRREAGDSSAVASVADRG